MGRSTVSSAISSRERRPAPTSVRDDEGRALSRSEAKSCSGELRPRGSRDGFAPLARSSGAALDRAAELLLGQQETRSETDPSSNLPVRARARAATRPVFGADTPPLAQTRFANFPTHPRCAPQRFAVDRPDGGENHSFSRGGA